MFDLELTKYALTQGGLTVVCLAMLYYMRRDYVRQQKEHSEERQRLIDLVEKNTAAMTTAAEASARVARALELLQLR